MRTFPEFAARMGGHKDWGGYTFTGPQKRTLRFSPLPFESKAFREWGGAEYVSCPPQDIHTFTVAELRAVARLYCQKRREERAAEKGKKTAESIRADWVECLPERLDEWTVVDKVQKCLVDNIGNFLMPLPTTPTSVVELLQQVNEVMEMME